MITAIVSSLLGMLGGVLPVITKEVTDSRAHAREMEHLRLQAQLQIEVAKQAGDNRLREIEASSAAEQIKALGATLTEIVKAQAQPSGMKWLDGLNAALRPVCAILTMGLFMAVSARYSWLVLMQMQATSSVAELTQLSNVIFTSLVGESFMAVMGFVYGYRSVKFPVRG